MYNLKLRGEVIFPWSGLSVFMTLILLLQSANAQGPPFSFPGGKRGREAITALQNRLPEVASRYGKSAGKLEQIFLHDHDLWLDPDEQLVYLCGFGAAAESLPVSGESAIPTGPFPLSETFQLHSLAGAAKVIYLDFDGHVTSGTYWNSNYNNGAAIVSEPYNFEGSPDSFSDAELSRIQKIWARVAEDFAMYNIDVTTEDPGLEALRRSGSGDNSYGIRVVVSPSSGWFGSAGGVAYVGSFDWNSDTPTFVFSDRLGNGNEKYVTDAASHETGHTLGLYHDGTTGGTEYYAGHGDWAPIMGVGYNQPITQWSRGEYAGANNTEDDLAVMLNNGASFRTDDHGDWIDNATMLSGDVLAAAGLIERATDVDVFGFQTGAGEVIINADPAGLDPNLDILLQIYDDGGNLVHADDPYYILPASLNLNLPAGTYYLLLDGVGTGDPDTGYTDYASLGQYFISATLPITRFPPEAPGELSALAISSSEVGLNWTDNSTNENGFSIERSPDGIDSWNAVGVTGTDSTSYRDSGLNPDSTYYYRVAAYNSLGLSGYSNTASANTLGLPPAAPSSLGATAASADSIDLHWTDNADSETGFAVERSADGVDGWLEIGAVAADSSAYTDAGLMPGTTYFYRVAAYNANGTSDYSNIAGATTYQVAPAGPTGLTALPVSFTRIDLNWQDNADNETGFRVERSPDGYAPWNEIGALPADSENYSDSTVSAGSTYYYRVYAYNSAGTGYSGIISATTAEPPPFVDQTAYQEAAVDGTVSGTFLDTHASDSAVEAITERTSGGPPKNRYSYLEHKWLIPVQPGSAATLYANTWAQLATAGETLVFSYSSDDEAYIDMFSVTTGFDDDSYYAYPLPPGLAGTVYVRVTDTLRSTGSYDRSTLYVDHLFIRTDNGGDSGTVPAAPSMLVADGATSDAITLSWLDNSDNEIGFQVERSSGGETGWAQIGGTGLDTSYFTDSGLTPGTTYYYRVQAFNAAGGSGYSNSASAATAEAGTLHLAALSGSAAINRNRWDASVTITVHDRDHGPVVGAAVAGSWDTTGSSTCVTGAAGQCTVDNSRLKTAVASTVFTVNNISGPGYIYDPAANDSDDFILVFTP